MYTLLFIQNKKIKQSVYKGVAALSLVAMSAGSAQAAFVSMDHEQFGSGSLLHDTSTGLTWLKFSSANYEYAKEEMQVTGKVEGFRRATAEDVFQLAENHGFNFSGLTYDVQNNGDQTWSKNYTSENFNPVDDLISNMGWTASGGWSPDGPTLVIVGGITADSVQGNDVFLSFSACYTDKPMNCAFEGGLENTGDFVMYERSDYNFAETEGYWLIWAPQNVHPAPEPSTYSMLLLGLGIAGMVARRHKRSVQ